MDIENLENTAKYYLQTQKVDSQIEVNADPILVIHSFVSNFEDEAYHVELETALDFVVHKYELADFAFGKIVELAEDVGNGESMMENVNVWENWIVKKGFEYAHLRLIVLL